MNYKTRNPIEDMLKVNSDENLEAVKKEIETLAEKGFTFFQWSSFSQPLNKPNAYKEAKASIENFDALSDDEQMDALDKWEEKQGNWFFIEVFSEIDGMKFMRGEGETFLSCINVIKEEVFLRENCTDHVWKYTHSNGHKTCGKCGNFSPCTVEEALANYKSGSVKYSKGISLQFNHEKPLCPHCSSHKRFFLSSSMKPEMSHKCTECDKFIKKEKEYSFEKTTYEERIKSRFCFINGHSVKKDHLTNHLNRFIHDMYKHALFVENVTIDRFSEWFIPHFNELFELISINLEKEDGVFQVVGINNFKTIVTNDKPTFSYSLKLTQKEEPIVDAADAFAEAISAIADSITKK